MFEEIESRAYHELDKKIKSYIDILIDCERTLRKRADEAKSFGPGFELENEYYDGRAISINLVISDLNSIIKTVERVTKKEIEAEFKRYEEYADAEIAADSARSKQS